MKVKEELKSYIYSQRNEAIKLLQQLVQQPSVRGNEGKTQAIVVEKCRQLGLEIDLWDLDEDPKLKLHDCFHCDRTSFVGNPNMVAVMRGSGGGKSIILNGHIDVVPEGNEADWHVSPFSGVEENDRIYGRGTTDMKGGNVALLLAVEAIARTNISLKGDVIFQSVIEEESGGAGTLATVLRGYTADAAIIPEPTSMKLFPYQQGSMWFRVHIKGKSAHGGTRYEGVSSLDLAYDVIQVIKQLEAERNEGLKKDLLYKGVPIPIPINIGICKTGNWPSSVPDLTILEGRFGVSPYETMEEAKKVLEKKIVALNENHDWFRKKPVELEWFGARWLPGRLELDHPLMKTVSENYRFVKNEEPIVEASPWGTDGGILSTVAHIPVVVFGPGVTEKAHDSNEYIYVDDLLSAAVIIACSLVDWCEIKAEE